MSTAATAAAGVANDSSSSSSSSAASVATASTPSEPVARRSARNRRNKEDKEEEDEEAASGGGGGGNGGNGGNIQEEESGSEVDAASEDGGNGNGNGNGGRPRRSTRNNGQPQQPQVLKGNKNNGGARKAATAVSAPSSAPSTTATSTAVSNPNPSSSSAKKQPTTKNNRVPDIESPEENNSPAAVSATDDATSDRNTEEEAVKVNGRPTTASATRPMRSRRQTPSGGGSRDSSRTGDGTAAGEDGDVGAATSSSEVIAGGGQSNDSSSAEVPSKRKRRTPRLPNSTTSSSATTPAATASATATTAPSSSPTKRLLRCKLCSAEMPSRSKLKRHAVDRHFKEEISRDLSNKRPYRCPAKGCQFEAEAFGQLVRHYGPSHAVEKYMAQVEYSDSAGPTTAPSTAKEASSGKIENGTNEDLQSVANDDDEELEEEEGETMLSGGESADEASENEEAAAGESRSAGPESQSDEEMEDDMGEEEEDEDAEDSEEEEEEEEEDGEENSEAVDNAAAADVPMEEDVDEDNVIVIKRGPGRPRKRHDPDAPKNMREFRRQVEENLKTLDGTHAVAVDERNIRCVCGKLVRLCNIYYWKYLVQKPFVRNGAVIQKGHWFTCPTVLEKGSFIPQHEISQEEIEASKAAAGTTAAASASASGKRSLSSSRANSDAESESESSPVKRRSRRVIKRTEAAAEAAAAAAAACLDEPAAKKRKSSAAESGEGSSDPAEEFSVERHIRDLLASRVPGETFLQDGPCFEMGFDVSMCRMCRLVPDDERREMMIKGVDEDSCDISCCFYGFRKLRATKAGQMTVKGYLNPKLDPTEKEMELWETGKTEPHVPPEKARHILGLIGDQFCDMVQQEYKCLSLNPNGSSGVVWKPAVKGVREMCDVCKTTLFNVHWTCDRCGMFICLDCYQHRSKGLVQDFSDTARRFGLFGEEPADEYGWPMCNGGEVHVMERLLTAQIIPRAALLDVARKLHEVRAREGINQFCHGNEEIDSLFSEDGLIKFGVSCKVSLVPFYSGINASHSISDCGQY